MSSKQRITDQNQNSTSECLSKGNQWIINSFQSKLQAVSGKSRNAYKIAIRGINQCPYKITNEHNAKVITGIGSHFGKYIAKHLKLRSEYIAQNEAEARLAAQQKIAKHKKVQQKEQEFNELIAKSTKKKRKTPVKKEKYPFYPCAKSEEYAILVCLCKAWKEHNIDSFTQAQIIRYAQQYSESLITLKSMSILIKYDYLQCINNEYYLQNAGKLISAHLYASEFGLPKPPKPNASMFNTFALNHRESTDDTLVDSKYNFKCQYCDKLYVGESAYKSHIQNKHKNGANAKKRPQLLPVYQSSDDEIVIMDNHCRKRPKTDTDSDGMKPLWIEGEMYELCLLFDNGEETAANANEKSKLMEQFNFYQKIKAKKCKLEIGDFCWVFEGRNKRYMYPIIIERKRMDDLVSSIRDKRYIEQKWRIKKNLSHFHHIYLIEDYVIDTATEKKQIKQALVNTNVCDGFLIYSTKSLIESIRIIAQWTHELYGRILQKLANNNETYPFFRSEKCLLFDDFESLLNVKKNQNIKARILFGRQLMVIAGVTDIIAYLISVKYETMRCLYNAWGSSDTVKEAKLLLNREINGTYLDYHRNLDTGEVEIDRDLQNVCEAMTDINMKFVSPKLSQKIWESLNL